MDLQEKQQPIEDFITQSQSQTSKEWFLHASSHTELLNYPDFEQVCSCSVDRNICSSMSISPAVVSSSPSWSHAAPAVPTPPAPASSAPSGADSPAPAPISSAPPAPAPPAPASPAPSPPGPAPSDPRGPLRL